jgi:hypothetical protein
MSLQGLVNWKKNTKIIVCMFLIIVVTIDRGAIVGKTGKTGKNTVLP